MLGKQETCVQKCRHVEMVSQAIRAGYQCTELEPSCGPPGADVAGRDHQAPRRANSLTFLTFSSDQHFVWTWCSSAGADWCGYLITCNAGLQWNG